MSVDEYYDKVLGVVHRGVDCEICKVIEGRN